SSDLIVHADAIPGWTAALSGRLRTVLGIGATVVPVPQHTFDRTEFKARRVIDDRDLHGSLVTGGATGAGAAPGGPAGGGRPGRRRRGPGRARPGWPSTWPERTPRPVAA